jgi:hypothetical protein
MAVIGPLAEVLYRAEESLLSEEQRPQIGSRHCIVNSGVAEIGVDTLSLVGRFEGRETRSKIFRETNSARRTTDAASGAKTPQQAMDALCGT